MASYYLVKLVNQFGLYKWQQGLYEYTCTRPERGWETEELARKAAASYWLKPKRSTIPFLYAEIVQVNDVALEGRIPNPNPPELNVIRREDTMP
jgi:hypothetical protein